jgi:hypothetical protein
MVAKPPKGECALVSPDNIKNVRIRKAITADPRTGALRSTKRAQEQSPILDADDAGSTDVASPCQANDRWMVALTIVGLCVLAGAMVAYVLYPAMATLLDASVVTWSGEGP